jgi:hypothetical protein
LYSRDTAVRLAEFPNLDSCHDGDPLSGRGVTTAASPTTSSALTVRSATIVHPVLIQPQRFRSPDCDDQVNSHRNRCAAVKPHRTRLWSSGRHSVIQVVPTHQRVLAEHSRAALRIAPCAMRKYPTGARIGDASAMCPP